MEEVDPDGRAEQMKAGGLAFFVPVEMMKTCWLRYRGIDFRFIDLFIFL